MAGGFNTQAELLDAADRLFAGMSANSADLGHLAGSRDKLGTMLSDIRDLLRQQSVFTAGKQETSKQIDQLFRGSARLLTVLRKAVAEHYGSGSEKMVEFGLQPFRGRRRPTVVVPPPPALE